MTEAWKIEFVLPEGSSCCGSRDVACIGRSQGHAVFRCGQCGTNFFGDRPQEDELRAAYSGGQYSESHRAGLLEGLEEIDASGFYKGEVSNLLRYLGRYREPLRFLDYGCSYGFLLRRAIERGATAYGVEPDPVVADYNRQMGIHMLTPTQLEACPPGFFSVIRANHVIEHLAEPFSTVKMLARKLAPRGILVVSSPCFSASLVGVDITRLADVVYPEHLFYFTLSGMRRLFERAGLAVEQCFSQFATDVQVAAAIDATDLPSAPTQLRTALEQDPFNAGSNLFVVGRQSGTLGTTSHARTRVSAEQLLPTNQVRMDPRGDRIAVVACPDGESVDLPVPLEVGAESVTITGNVLLLGFPGTVRVEVVGRSVLSARDYVANRAFGFRFSLLVAGERSVTVRVTPPGPGEIVFRDVYATSTIQLT